MPAMTRQHYTAVAATIFHERHMALLRDEDTTALDNTVKALCITFSRFNPQFDRQKFLSACGMAP